MITIFNRKLLYFTYDITVQSKIRSVLAANGIDYYLNPSTACMYSSRPEYKFYVKKSDHEYAEHLIQEVLR